MRVGFLPVGGGVLLSPEVSLIRFSASRAWIAALPEGIARGGVGLRRREVLAWGGGWRREEIAGAGGVF